MVKDNKVVNPDIGLKMFDSKKDDEDLQSLFYKYTVHEVDVSISYFLVFFISLILNVMFGVIWTSICNHTIMQVHN